MSDDRIIVAIGRIERALTRLERFTESRATEPHPADEALLADYRSLSGRHAALRAESEAAVAAMDALIARLEAPGGNG